VYVYVLYVCEKDIKAFGLVLGLENSQWKCMDSMTREYRARDIEDKRISIIAIN
jgi:hypothetical protein